MNSFKRLNLEFANGQKFVTMKLTWKNFVQN